MLQPCLLFGEEIRLTVIARRSRHFAGTRYLKRGISKQALGDIDGACGDWKIAAELGDEDAAKLIERFSQ